MSSAAHGSTTKIDFDLPLIGQALGGSMIYEEYKGDLAAARLIADSAVADETKTEFSRAHSFLALGIVQMLQGELILAQASFSEVDKLTTSDPDLQYFAFTCRHMAQMYQYRFAADGGLFTIELEERWDGIKFSGEQEKRFSDLRGGAQRSSTHMQSALAYHVLSMMPVHRQMVDNGRASMSQEQMREFLSSLLSGTLAFRQVAANSAARLRILAFIDRHAADLARRAGMIDVADQTIGRAAQLYSQDRDATGAGTCYMVWGDWRAAVSSSPILWNLFAREGTGDGSNLTWITEASEFSLDGADFSQASEAYATAADCFTRGGSRRGLAALKLREAYFAILKEDWLLAVQLFAVCRGSAELTGDRLMAELAAVSGAMAGIGISPRNADLATMRKAGEWGIQSGSIAYAAGLGLLAGRIARHWVLRRGDYERSAACYRMARSLYSGLGMVVNEAQTFVDLGNLHTAVGDRYAAIEALESSSMALKKAGERTKLQPFVRRTEIENQLRLYKLYEDAKDPEGIERIIEKLNAGFPAQDQPALRKSFGLGRLLEQVLSVGTSQSRLDHQQEVMNLLVNQLACSTVETGQVTAAIYRAVQANDKGRKLEAEIQFTKALTFAKSAQLASKDFLEAVVLAHKCEYGAAVEAFLRFLNAGGSNSGPVRTMLDHIKANSASGRVEEAAQAKRTAEVAASFMLSCHNYLEAKHYFEQVEQVSGTDWWRHEDDAWETASNYGEVFEGLGQFDRALEWYDRGIDAFEKNRVLLNRDELKVALANKRGSKYLYFYAARCALRLKHHADAQSNKSASDSAAAQAFGYAEAGRARALLDLLASENSNSDLLIQARRLYARIATWKGLLGHLIERGNSNDGEVANLRARIREEEDLLSIAEKELFASDETSSLDARGEVISLASISAQLEARECVLQYFFMGDDLLIWIISEKGMIASRHQQESAGELTYLIESFRKHCEAQLPARQAGMLAAKLIQPVANDLSNFERIVIVPHGVAHGLPFHLLPLGGCRFGESHTISQLPSASVMQHLDQRWQGLADTVLTVGNPSNMIWQNEMGREGMRAAPLFYSEIEAKTVSSFFSYSELLAQEEATKERVLQHINTNKVVHLATHAYTDAEQPELSGILLANGEVLRVFELGGLHLQADLVVLSGCDTGRGRATGGDDILGLARAFISAGVRFLVVSLWPVDDRAAMVMMRRFYSALQGGTDPANALRRAQCKMRTLTAEEFRMEVLALSGGALEESTVPPNWGCPYWAPFVLIGR